MCQFVNEVAAYGYELAMHLVVAYFVGFHRLECPGSYVQGEFAPRNAPVGYFFQHLVGEMQPGGGCCYRAVDV